MRRSKVLAKFRQGNFARVCSLGHVLPFFIRHAAHLGYDGIWLDLEHRAMTDREVQTLLAFCYHNDIDCMVRPATVERARLSRYLEDGATGFLVPFVSDVATALEIVRAVKFPPLGNRGVDGAGLDADFMVKTQADDSNYVTEANRETFILAQIETKEAVLNVNEIAAVPGLDGIFVGPADLSLRLSLDRGGRHITFEDAVHEVAKASRHHNKVWGIAPRSVGDLGRYYEMGAQIIPWGSDYGLVKVLQASTEELDTVVRGNEKLASVDKVPAS